MSRFLAADEPLALDNASSRGGWSRKRATPVLTRRVKQAIAEWYVLQMLELSWDGFCAHTEQGWNIGKPCYGYLSDKVPHPVPARRAEGKTKTRLIPDPARGPVVTRIMLARDTTLWTDDVWVVDSPPVECGRPRETARRSDLAGWAGYGYCASHSRYFRGLRLHMLAPCTACRPASRSPAPGPASARCCRASSPTRG